MTAVFQYCKFNVKKYSEKRKAIVPDESDDVLINKNNADTI